jgi:hypothetical protein
MGTYLRLRQRFIDWIFTLNLFGLNIEICRCGLCILFLKQLDYSFSFCVFKIDIYTPIFKIRKNISYTRKTRYTL